MARRRIVANANRHDSMTGDPLDRPDQPAYTYAEAVGRFEALVQRDTSEVDPASRSRLIGPGERNDRVNSLLCSGERAPARFGVDSAARKHSVAVLVSVDAAA